MNDACAKQESFLDGLINSHTPVNIFLINGIRLSGIIQSYDPWVVLLDSPTGMQTIDKHSVSTIQDVEHKGPHQSSQQTRGSDGTRTSHTRRRRVAP
jgi:host factor-I protein